MIEYQIRIDVKGQRTLYTDAVFTTGDVQAYRLRFLFYDDGAPYDVSGCSLVLRGKRSDGVVITDVGHIGADGMAYYDVNGSLYTVAGSLSVEVALTGAADEYLTAKELIFNVRGGHGDGDPAMEDTAPVISHLLAETQQTADNVTALQSDFDSHISASVMAHRDGSVTAEKIRDGAVTANKLGTDVKAALSNKVDKEPGKGLSTNDFTDEYKEKLGFLYVYDDSELRGLIGYKVDQIQGKGLSANDFTDADKEKLDNMYTADGVIPPQRIPNPPAFTSISGAVNINSIYDLGVQTSLTITLPNGEVGDYLQIDFISGATPTNLTINATSTALISDYDFVPEANSIYTLFFDYGRLSDTTYGWRFSSAEYTYSEV